MRRRFHILVKGTDALAAEEARLRGCVVLTTMGRSSDYASMLVGSDDKALASWYNAGRSAPFPDGELMHYKEVSP